MSNIEIIAELAQGFEGKPELASLLLQAAAKAGADAAKFQLVYADELSTPDYEYYGLFKSLEMPDDVWRSLKRQADDENIELHVDVFGKQSLALAEELQLPSIKLHGTDISNLGYLELVAKSGVESIHLGAGGAHQSEINAALDILSNKDVVVYLGFQAYPTPDNANQIHRVARLAEILAADDRDVRVGFADHAAPETANRLALASAAVGAGAKSIEKHLTLGRNMELEDFESALNPDEFGEFVSTIRSVAQACAGGNNDDDFGMSEDEKKYRSMIRRHVVSACPLKAGTVILPNHVELKRSALASPIFDIGSVYGKKLTKDTDANVPINAEHLE